MAVDLSDHTEYECRDCRTRCLRPADSEEALRGRCVDCLRLGSLHELSEVDLLDDLDLDWFLAQLDQNQREVPERDLPHMGSRPGSRPHRPDRREGPHVNAVPRTCATARVA